MNALDAFKDSHVKDRRHLLKVYKNCFIGKKLVDFLIEYSGKPETKDTELSRQQAIDICNSEFKKGTFVHVLKEHDFEDKHLFYRFTADFLNSNSSTQVGDLTDSPAAAANPPTKKTPERRSPAKNLQAMNDSKSQPITDRPIGDKSSQPSSLPQLRQSISCDSTKTERPESHVSAPPPPPARRKIPPPIPEDLLRRSGSATGLSSGSGSAIESRKSSFDKWNRQSQSLKLPRRSSNRTKTPQLIIENRISSGSGYSESAPGSAIKPQMPKTPPPMSFHLKNRSSRSQTPRKADFMRMSPRSPNSPLREKVKHLGLKAPPPPPMPSQHSIKIESMEPEKNEEGGTVPSGNSSFDTKNTNPGGSNFSSMDSLQALVSKPNRRSGRRRTARSRTPDLFIGQTRLQILQSAAELKSVVEDPSTPASPQTHLDAETLSPSHRLSDTSSHSSFDWRSEQEQEFTYPDMVHQFPTVEAQTRAGLSVLGRIAKFTRKQSDILKSTIGELTKLHTYEKGKMSECKQNDTMRNHLSSMEDMYQVEKSFEKELTSLRGGMIKLIVEPASRYVETSLKKMDELAKTQKQKSSSLEAASMQLSEARKSCLKKFKELKSVHDKLKGISRKSGKEKDKKRYDEKKKKAQEAALKQFTKTEILEREYQNEQRLYRHSWLPKTLEQMQDIELQRLSLQQKVLQIHASSHLSMFKKLTEDFAKSKARADSLSAKRDMNETCSQWKREYGVAPPLSSRPPLPCTSEDLKSDQWVKLLEEKASMTHLGERKIKSERRKSTLQLITNTPIDKTTTIEAEGEEWFRSISDFVPVRGTDLRLEPDDIVHLLDKNPKNASVVKVWFKPLAPGEKVSMISLDVGESNKSKNLLSRLAGYSSGKGLGIQGEVTKVWQDMLGEDKVYYCEVTAKDTKIPKQIFVQEVNSTSVSYLTPGNYLSIMYDFKGEESLGTLTVGDGEEVLSLKVMEDFVLVRERDGKEGLVPISITRMSHKKKPDSEDLLPTTKLPSANLPRTVTTMAMWDGLNIRNMEAGHFPPHLVKSVSVSAKDFGQEDEEDDDEEEGNTKASGGSFGFSELIKSKVSKKKRRFIRDGFNLDLSYVTPKIIAMGFPSSGMEAKYRNNIIDVQRFFQERHRGKFWIWNLCIEKNREYDRTKFENAVTRTGFHDHNPCPFDMIEPFCKEVKSFLDKRRDNVAAIHCKAGKGRTGFLISCYLIYANSWFNADRALRFFAVKRTKNQKGVTIPSQRRYVGYFDRVLRERRSRMKSPQRGRRAMSLNQVPIPRSRSVRLMRISLQPIPSFVKTDHVNFIIWNPNPSCNDDKKNVWKSKSSKLKCQRRPAQDYLLFTAGQKGVTSFMNDAKFTFTYDAGFMSKTQKMFHYWLNARFLHPIPGKPGFFSYTLYKAELDKACKDKKHEDYADNFRVEMEFCLDDNL